MRKDLTGNGSERNSEQKLHFLDYWRIIQKRKEVIIATLIIIVLTTAVISMIQKDQYQATAVLEVSTKKRSVDIFGPQMRSTGVDPSQLNTYLKGLMFADVLRSVVRGEIYKGETLYYCPVCKEYMTKDDLRRLEVKGMICPTAFCSETLKTYNQKKYPTWEPLNEKWTKRDKPEEKYTEEMAIMMLRKNLKVRLERGAYHIRVSYRSENAQEASQIATMVAEAYVQFRKNEEDAKFNEAMGKVQEQIKEFKEGNPINNQKGLIHLEEELNKLMQEMRLSPEMGTALNKQMELRKYRDESSQLSMVIVQLEQELKKLKDLNPEEKADIIQQNNVTIASLKQQLITARLGKQQLLGNGYNERHPQIIALDKNIAKLQDQINSEVTAYIYATRARFEQLTTQKERIDSMSDTTTNELFKDQEKMTEIIRYQSEVAIQKNVYQEMMLRKFRETIQAALPLTDITLAQQAEVPRFPFKPKPLLNIILSFFIGLIVGTGLAYFIEYLDTSVKTIDDIERHLNIPILGVIPQDAKLLTEEDPKSPVAEAYRMLWTNIEFADIENGNKIQTLLVTSAGAGEGKTTTAVNLAIAVAQMGYKVLLIDSDLRRPRIHKLLKYQNKSGWADILLKRMKPAEVTFESEIEGLWVIPSGKLPKNIVSLLNTPRIRDSIGAIAEGYDIVIFDSPPVLGVSDTAIISNMIDAILLVVEYRKYPKAMANRAKRSLENVGANLVGGVVNNLNVMKEDYYYYSQMYHYQQPYTYEDEEETQEDAESRLAGSEKSRIEKTAGKESDSLGPEGDDKDITI